MRERQATTTYLKDYRPPNYLIDTTDLKFELDDESTLVSSKLSFRRNPDVKGWNSPALVLDGQELELLAVTLDGEPLSDADYALSTESLTIAKVPDQFVLEIQVRIKPIENTALEGLYISDGMHCTQCEAQGFRRITYYLDRPDVMSQFTTEIIANQSSNPVLLSNGNLLESEELTGGHHSVKWLDPHMKPAYLFALVAGKLEFIEDHFVTCSGRDVTLRIFVEAKDLDKCDHAVESLKSSMKWDEEVYGREYDLDIFMIVAVDAFNMGAMENKGLNIFNSSCVLAKPETTTDLTYQRIEAIVAHEYFHNWSGNRVTCRDWFQLSLKEGLTVYRDSQFSADMGSKTVKRIEDVALLRTVQFAEDAGPMAHPVRPDAFMEISNFYTVTIYEKGAELIRMMHHLVGEAGFRRGTDLYFDRHDGQAVTTEDFVKALEDANQIDLTQFSRWYAQSGTPVLKIADQYDAQNQQYRLTVEQSCPATPGQPHKEPFHIPLLIGLLDADGNDLPLLLQNDSARINGATSLTLEVTSAKQQFVFDKVPNKPTPSLLRGFSAPVKLEFDYSSADLEFLAQHDSDGFNRWDALQKRIVALILGFAEKLRQGEELKLPAQLVLIYSSVLADSESEPELAAKMLLIPTEAYLWELVDEVDVESIHRAREFVKQQLALALIEPLLAVYRAQSSDEIYQATSQQMARRSLKNIALQYLVWSGEQSWLQMAMEQASSGSNMTDVSAALGALVNSMAPQAEQLSSKALEQFYLNWKHEPLVVNQWLALQAGCPRAGALQRVEKLLEHDAFDIRNPNKVRSVIGVFCAQNRVHFHHENGAGYRFLEQQVIGLDGINPQIASRLLTPLTQWGKHNQSRQTLMKKSLSKILEKGNLSKDVYEVASKSLG